VALENCELVEFWMLYITINHHVLGAKTRQLTFLACHMCVTHGVTVRDVTGDCRPHTTMVLVHVSHAIKLEVEIFLKMLASLMKRNQTGQSTCISEFLHEIKC